MPPTLHRFLFGAADRSGFLERLGIGLVVAAVLIGIYQIIGREVTPGPWNLATPLDYAVPFLPWTAWFYTFIYALVFLIPVWIMDDRPTYLRTFAVVIATSVPSWLLHAAFPIAYPRPPYPTGPGASDTLMRMVYAFDPPQNTFPSLHVGLATAMLLATWPYRGWARIAVTTCAALMMVSVLTTKQHFLVDIVGGWVVAGLAWRWVRRFDFAAVVARVQG